MGKRKKNVAKEVRGKYFGYKNELDFAIETLPDKELREAIKECNRSGARVKGFFTTLEISELASMALRITKENERRLFNILRELEANHCLRIVLAYDEFDHLDTLRIFGNIRNKAKVFTIVRSAVKKKSDFDTLSPQLQEIYKMHKSLVREDLEHQIKYKEGRLLQSTIICNIDSSYFSYGADRVKKIYSSMLWENNDDMRNGNYTYRFRDKNSMLNKMKQINVELDKEFQWQADELEALSAKYRWDPNDENSDMFVRLAKVRDGIDF
ncbi:MAG: hypothetical protein IJ217_03520 [Clostridia bacterium]|nr:hypothetical protein [Clostridia bacterium]